MEPLSLPIHRALYRPLLFAGAPRRLVVLEAALVVGLLYMTGLSLPSLGMALFYLLVVHPLLVWLTKLDAQAFELYLRSLRYRDFYPGGSGALRRPLAVGRSVPTRS